MNKQTIADLTLQGIRAETMDLAALIRDPRTRPLVEAMAAEFIAAGAELQNILAHLQDEMRRAA